eukprot:jgi/Phyca11/122315/e_gw1.47.367.1
MELPLALTKPRWTARDSICVGLAVFVVLNVLMCLWVAVTSMSTAHRQATAVFSTLENAPAIAFNLTRMSSTERLNVTGRLRPRFSECSHRLHFDGRMEVTTANTSEVFVLTNHRGYRRSRDASGANATCLTTQDLPPLHTVADTVRSAFRPQNYAEFNVNCKPLQFSFFNAPYVVNYVTVSTTTNNDDQSWLVIHGKRSALELKILTDVGIDEGQPFLGLNRCEYLEAPMTTGESCSLVRPHINACLKQEASRDGKCK